MTDAAPDVLTRRDLVPILTLEEITDNDLEAFVEQLPEDRIPQAIVRIADFRAGLARLEKMLEARYATTPLATQVWRDPATALRYAWMTRSSSARIDDMPGFFSELHGAGVSPRTTAAAISATGIRITDLRDSAKDDPERAKAIERIIKTYRRRVPGPEHLTCLDRVEE